MKFGVCAGLDQVHLLQDAGFDYVECTVVSLEPEEDDHSFQNKLRQFQNSSLPIHVFNVFLPGDLKIVGPNIDEHRIRRYVQKALERVKKVGGDTIVFGSGAARKVPAGFDRNKAWDQIRSFLHIVADYAEPLNLTIAIEPLNRGECNILNSVPEAVEMVNDVGRSPISVLADFYHMDEEDEPLENIVRYQDYITHIHVADTGRRRPGSGSYPYAQFVDCLERAGYRGRVSIECGWDDLQEEASSAYSFLREQFEK